MAGKQIMLGDQILHGNDRYGWWQINKIEGWDETPPAKSNTVDRVNGHGSYPATVYYGSRTVTLSGRLVAKNHALAAEAKRRLTALLQVPSNLVVASDDLTPIAGTANRGRISPGPVQGRWMTFDVELTFPDPFKYGERRSVSVASGASDTVFHRGTVEAWPTVSVSGNMPGGYTVTLGGQSVSVPMGIPSGATHTIDYRRRRLYINGELFMGAFGSQNFKSVAPGQRTSVSLSASSGSGTASVTVYDTYV